MLSVLLCSLFSFVSAQYEGQPIPFQPIPLILQLPDRGQQSLSNLRYSIVDNGRNEGNRGMTLNEINNFQPNLRRYDDTAQLPNKMGYQDDGARYARYQERYDHFPSRRPERNSRGLQTSKNSEQRQKQRSRYSRKDVLSVHRNILREEKAPSTGEMLSGPRIVKYIADKNGFAVREDLYRPLQESVVRSRSKPRILTTGSSPLMAHVVTSAIRVANHQPSSSGRFVPQVIDLKVGM